MIAHHRASLDPKYAALEQAVSERNTLSSQNAQLWKLIEKQRSGYNQILKELERVRTERDIYKSKLGHRIKSPEHGDTSPVDTRGKSRSDEQRACHSHYHVLKLSTNATVSSTSRFKAEVLYKS